MTARATRTAAPPADGTTSRSQLAVPGGRERARVSLQPSRTPQPGTVGAGDEAAEHAPPGAGRPGPAVRARCRRPPGRPAGRPGRRSSRVGLDPSRELLSRPLRVRLLPGGLATVPPRERREEREDDVGRLVIVPLRMRLASEVPVEGPQRGRGPAAGRKGRPASRSRIDRAARSPQAADSTYPSTPVTCPAKNRWGRSRADRSPARTRGASRKVFRWICPSRRNSAPARPGTKARKTRRCSGQVRRVWKPDQVPGRPGDVLAPELDHRVRPAAGARVLEARPASWARRRAPPRPRSAITSMGRQPSK